MLLQKVIAVKKNMIDHKIVLSLIKAALDGTPADLGEDFPIDEYIQFASMQQIEALLVTGMLKSGVTLSADVRKMLYGAVMISSHQLSALERLCNVFSENGIDHMPLKGSMLKSLYPSDELRSMGDIDMLVRMDQYDRVRPLMLAEGYQEGDESDHEYHWTREDAHIELHKRLIPSYNKDYYAFYGEGWQLAKPCSTLHRFVMSHEDTFIFLFTHYAKHYRDAGVGVRQALDLYVYRMAYPDIDEVYVLEKMQLLQLNRFYANTMCMLDVWFKGSTHTGASQLIEDRLFSSGVFGTRENSLQSTMLKEANTQGTVKKAKLIKWLNILFLPRIEMCKLYPFLKRIPCLLPVMWAVRWGDVLFHRRNRIHARVQENKDVNSESIEAYHEMLHKSGLDFNFK